MCPSGMGPAEGVHSWGSTTWYLKTSNTDKTCTTKSKYNNTLHFEYQISLDGTTTDVASLTNIMGTDLKLQNS
jgi:hypothetical protein